MLAGNVTKTILRSGILIQVFALQADQELRSYGPATELTGSTATVAMVRRGELVCANLGDSRAVASVRLAFKQRCKADTHHVRHRVITLITYKPRVEFVDLSLCEVANRWV